MSTLAIAACSTSATLDDRTFDACAPISIVASTATASERASVTAAAALWGAVGVDTIDVAETTGSDGAATVTLVFADGGPAEYGYYDGAAASIMISVELDDTTRPIVIAHELGHMVGLVHVPPSVRASVMNAGNLDVAPTAADAAAVAAIWGCP